VVTPTQPAGAPKSGAAVAGEQDLTELAAAILTGRHRRELSRSQRTMLTAVRNTHSQHRIALGGPAPTSRPTTSSPSAAPSPAPAPPVGLAGLTLTQSLRLLARQEQRQAARLRRRALQDVGYDALLWASMMVVADSFARVLVDQQGVPVDTDPGARPPMPAVSDVEALQIMVGQLHAVVYGYQLALGQLPASSSQGRRALSSLGARRSLRDELVQVLLSRSASVPAAAPAYVPSVDPRTAGRSARLIRRMETDLQPFCGLWLASSSRLSDRRLALGALADTVSNAQRWGAAISVWPGWQR
jgi:hypothetical protein